MTTKTTKAVTVGALAAALAIMVAYSAFILPASAQAPTTTTTTTSTGSSTATSSTSATTGSMSAPPGPVCKQGGGPGGMVVVQGRGGPMGGPFGFSTRAQANLTVGQTITITSSKGEYVAIANPDDNGTASGTITFTVTGKLAGGYTLSITSGSITVNGTPYTISSGSAQMDISASHLEGQGTTTSSGAFLVAATAHGTFAGTTATMSLDLTNGSTEYLVALSGTT